MRRPLHHRVLALVLSAVAVFGSFPGSVAADATRDEVAAADDALTHLPWHIPITIPRTAIFDTWVAGRTSVNQLSFELHSPAPNEPPHVLPVFVCGPCAVTDTRRLGTFDVGEQLVFVLRDLTYDKVYRSDDATHAKVERLGPDAFRILWDDAGDDGIPDRDFNDLTTVIAPTDSALHDACFNHHINVPGLCINDPVNTRTGSYIAASTDFALPGIGLPLEFTRSYLSSQSGNVGVFGPGWTHSYAVRLDINPDSSVDFITEQGTPVAYHWTGSSYVSNPGVRSSLRRDGSSYLITRHDQVVYQFDSTGRLVRLSDRNANSLTFVHTSGRLSRITDTAGRNLDLTYNASGRLTRVAGPLSRSVAYGYDASGRLTSFTDARGGITRYSYDASNRLVTVTDANGRVVVTNTYGSDGRITSQVDAAGHRTTFGWNASTGIATVTDRGGGVWTDDYAGLVIASRRDPLGNTTSFTFDANYNLTTLTDPRGHVSRFSHDARGNVLSATSALSTVWSFTYDDRNNRLSSRDPRGNTTTYQYDSRGNLTRAIQPGNLQTSFTRNTAGLVTAITDARGEMSTYSYDTQGNLIGLNSPLGHQTTMAYDAAGRLTRLVDGRGNVDGSDPSQYATTLSYDAGNRITSVVDALGNDSRFAYDAVGNLLSFTDANEHTTSWTYDPRNNLASVTSPVGAVTRYTYDENAALSSRTDALGRVTAYEYDLAGRLLSVTDPLANTWSYAYDPSGNLTSRTDANGRQTAFTYDAIGRLTRIDYPSGFGSGPYTPDVSLAYDAAGNLTRMTDGDTETYAYDSLNRLTRQSRVAGETNTFTYTYDAVGNLLSRAYPGRSPITYSYDADGRLTGVTADGATTTYEYDAAANLRAIVYPNGHTESREYDRVGRLVGQETTTFDAALFYALNYTHDAVGNLTTMTRSEVEDVAPRETFTYEYDGADRLIATCFDAACADYVRYRYDKVGNRLSQERPAGTTTYTYDAGDRLITESGLVRVRRHIAGEWRTIDLPQPRTYAYDRNGNQISAGADRFRYDSADRLVEAEVGEFLQTYAYAGDGRRISATTTPAPVRVPQPPAAPSPTLPPLGSSECLDNPRSCLGQTCPGGPPCPPDPTDTDSRNSTTAMALDVEPGLVEYVWDINASLPMLAREYTEGTGTKHYTYGHDLLSFTELDGTSYYHNDRLGSVMYLTSETGVPQAAYSYEPFGAHRYAAELDTGAPDNRMTFTGEYFDAPTGLYHLRARQYDPRTGRFLSVDPASQPRSRGNTNGYAYASNNPTRYTDPSGRCGVDIFTDAVFTGFSVVTLLQHGIMNLQGADKDLGGDVGYLALDAGGFLVPCVTGAGFFKRGAEAVANTAIAVIGKKGEYIQLADELGAARFDVPPEIWDSWDAAQRWAANQRWLDEMIAEGREFVLASDPIHLSMRSHFWREIQYLVKQGYEFTDGFRSLVPGS